MSLIKKNISKISLLVLCFIFATSFTVFASDEAKVNDITFETLDEAINTAQSGETIKLISNVDLGATGTYSIDGQKHGVNITEKALILDLNGYELKSTCAYSTIRIAEDGKLTIIDTSEVKSGKY